MKTLRHIRKSLKLHQPVLLDDGGRIPTSVAMILLDLPNGVELLFIERAAHARDPWSGNIGFPGGKLEKDDRDLQHAAQRESLEEVGIDLGLARPIGRLSDIAGAHLPIRVSCFVYYLDAKPLLSLSAEVRDAFWIRLDLLLCPERHITATVPFAGDTHEVPAIRLPQPDKPVLWGITYRLVMQLFGILALPGSAHKE